MSRNILEEIVNLLISLVFHHLVKTEVHAGHMEHIMNANVHRDSLEKTVKRMLMIVPVICAKTEELALMV